jgi:hypothetical protein
VERELWLCYGGFWLLGESLMLALRRRDFITLLGGVALSWPIAAYAQLGTRMRRIGAMMLLAEDDPQQKAWTEAFLGWIDRSNIQIDYRWDTARWRGGGVAARGARAAARAHAAHPAASVRRRSR